jgi:cytoskeletal protein RodZ
VAQPPAPYPANAGSPGAPAAPQRKITPKKLILIVSSAVVGLCLLCGIVGAVFGASATSSPENAPSTPTTTAPSRQAESASPSPTHPSASPSPTHPSASPSPTASPSRSNPVKPKASTTTKAAPKTTKATPKTDPMFPTCKAANAAGYGPYYRDKDPEYYWYQDRDHDGVVCE